MDHRDYSHYPEYSVKQDHENRTLILYPDEIEELVLIAKYDVCPSCEGRGRYVNPLIDSHGLTAEDFADDPDFQEAYFSEQYDITCRSCNGRNVILVPTAKDGIKQLEELLQEEHQYRCEVETERRHCRY